MIQVVRENAITIIISATDCYRRVYTFNQNERDYIPYAIKIDNAFARV